MWETNLNSIINSPSTFMSEALPFSASHNRLASSKK